MSMIKSKHNIISKIADSDKYFLINLLSQHADILSKEEYHFFEKDKKVFNAKEYIAKGYIVEEVEEKSLLRRKYLDFLDDRETDEVQLFFVPNYTCNFSCSYCYQDEYTVPGVPWDKEVVEAFFSYVEKEFKNRKRYVTLFGGEPLLDNNEQRTFVSNFIERCGNSNLELAIVTNGYTLSSYIPVLKNVKIRELQITLDGVGQAHDNRRSRKGGGGTFQHIVQGINAALENKLPVNLRMVVDKSNIEELPRLARYAIEQGWTKNSLFKTQLGRNYELHHCQSGAGKLYSRLEMYKDIYSLLKDFPEILEFHKPAFSVSKFLFEQGELPLPLFDSCPGTKTEWAFDYTGKIYSCTATVGKYGEALGSYFPHVSLNKEPFEEWQERDVLSIEKCTQCELALACGGGCAAVAKNNHGVVNAPDCRPIKELLELGIAHYFSG